MDEETTPSPETTTQSNPETSAPTTHSNPETTAPITQPKPETTLTTIQPSQDTALNITTEINPTISTGLWSDESSTVTEDTDPEDDPARLPCKLLCTACNISLYILQS